VNSISNLVKVNNFSEDINIDNPRGRFIALSSISSRAILAHLDTLFILYIKRIKAQNNDSFWFNQTE